MKNSAEEEGEMVGSFIDWKNVDGAWRVGARCISGAAIHFLVCVQLIVRIQWTGGFWRKLAYLDLHTVRFLIVIGGLTGVHDEGSHDDDVMVVDSLT